MGIKHKAVKSGGAVLYAIEWNEEHDGVGLNDGDVCELPTAVEGKVLGRGPVGWGAIDPLCTIISREISGNTGAIASGVKTVCNAVIGQSGKRSIMQGGIIRGVQTLTAGKKATVYVSKYNGVTWDLVDKYDITKDSLLEANIGHAAHNDYMKMEVEHNDVGNNRTFTYVFVIQDME